jgi:ABC-type glycerol-3-phosphate transport system substrate-binding protein
MRGERHALSRRVRGAVAVLSLALGVIACSSDDDEDAASTSSAASTPATDSLRVWVGLGDDP